MLDAECFSAGQLRPQPKETSGVLGKHASSAGMGELAIEETFFPDFQRGHVGDSRSLHAARADTSSTGLGVPVGSHEEWIFRIRTH